MWSAYDEQEFEPGTLCATAHPYNLNGDPLPPENLVWSGPDNYTQAVEVAAALAVDWNAWISVWEVESDDSSRQVARIERDGAWAFK